MTVARLLALSDRQRVRWANEGLFGVVERAGGRLRIVWSTGEASDVATADVDLDGFARELSLVHARDGQ